MVRKILLFYCTLLAMFMNTSGLVAAKQTQDYLLQAVFLPVTLFLIFSSFKTLTARKKEKKQEIVPAGKPIAAIVLFSFLLLLALVARQAVSQPQEIISPLSSSQNTPSITPTPTAVIPQNIIVTTENPKIPVNVRTEPASSSAILAKIKSGAVFPCLDSKEGWYQIQLKNGKSGWVYGEFVKPEEENK